MGLFKYDPKIILHQDRYNVVFYDPETRRRKWHSLGTDSEDIAQRRFREIFRAYERGEFDPMKDRYHFGELTFDQAKRRFLAQGKERWTPATYQDYDKFLEMVANRLPAGMLLQHLSRADCRRIVNQPAARASQRGYYRRLRAFINWAITEAYMKDSPLEDVHQPKAKKQPPAYLTKEEFALLAKTIHEAAMQTEPSHFRRSLIRLHRVVRFAVNTGLRLQELRGLKWKDVDRTAGRLNVLGKGDKHRSVPLFDDARAVLDEIVADHEEQFEASPPPDLEVFAGLPYYDTSGQVTRFLREAKLKHKVGRKAVHLLRHTFASWAVMAGVPLYTVKEWMGHSTVTTTEIYAHLSPDYVPEAAYTAFSSGLPGSKTAGLSRSLSRGDTGWLSEEPELKR